MDGYAEISTVQSEFGTPPTIDGVIDGTTSEWNDANKINMYLYPNISDPINGLPIEVWVMQSEVEVFISIQFELVNHGSITYLNEFVGILISDTESSNPENFEDAKVVQFENITNGDYYYKDFNLDNMIFSEDLDQDGEGAAKLEGLRVTYEFSMPIKNNESDTEDVYLNYGLANQKAYKIILGTNMISSDNVLVENNIIINLQFPPVIPDISLEEILLITLNIIIFGFVGAFYIYYIYRITQLKKIIRKIRR
jgi:hypothetical protein